MGIWRDIGHPVTLLHTKSLQGSRPLIAAIQKFAIGEPQVAVNDGLPFGVQSSRAVGEFNRR